jgi:hypothetical protein
VRSASVNLSSIVPGLSVEEAALAIAWELSGAESEAAEAAADRPFAEEAARRLASWEWTWGATPAFSLCLPWSGGRTSIEIKGGIVASASGPGAERIADISGRRFGYETPAAAALALEGRGAYFS